jgi:uncharacterized membrane protein YfcA
MGMLSVFGLLGYVAALTELGVPAAAAATVLAVGFAGFLSGIAGFAFSAICGAILFHFRHDTVGVVQIMLVCSLANQAMNVWLLRRDIAFGALSPFVLGGALGVPAGVWLLLHLDATAFKMTLGVLLAIYGATMLLRRPMVLRRAVPGGHAAVGFLGGIVGGFAATPGAVAAIWCGMQPWHKAQQRAVVQPYILAMQVLALLAIAAMHPHGGPSAAIPSITWACVPAGLAGTWWGMALFRRLTDNQFAKAVNVLLLVSGIGLVL